MDDIQGTMGKVPIVELITSVAYVSCDPGIINKASTGIVIWDKNGKVRHTNELDLDNLQRFLDWIEDDTNKPLKIITEEFRLYQNKALQQSGSKLETVQIIGVLRRVAYRIPCEFVEVRADAKDVAAMWSQTKVPKGHMPNWMSAYLVGYYHLHEIGVIRAKVLDL